MASSCSPPSASSTRVALDRVGGSGRQRGRRGGSDHDDRRPPSSICSAFSTRTAAGHGAPSPHAHRRFVRNFTCGFVCSIAFVYSTLARPPNDDLTCPLAPSQGSLSVPAFERERTRVTNIPAMFQIETMPHRRRQPSTSRWCRLHCRFIADHTRPFLPSSSYGRSFSRFPSFAGIRRATLSRFGASRTSRHPP